MKTNKTTRKPLQLKTETLARLDGDALKHVRGGEAPGELGLGLGALTELQHSCNPACHYA